MTWAEFKIQIDKQLKEQGVSEDTEIGYFDFSYPCKGQEMHVGVDEQLGIIIT